MRTAKHNWIADILAFLPGARAGAHGQVSWPARIRPRERRMGVRPPVRSQPVQNRETITSLIVVAAALLDTELWGGVFTFEQLMKKMRELLRPGQTLATDDVRAVLPAMGYCLATAGDWGWWKRRVPAHPG